MPPVMVRSSPSGPEVEVAVLSDIPPPVPPEPPDQPSSAFVVWSGRFMGPINTAIPWPFNDGATEGYYNCQTSVDWTQHFPADALPTLTYDGDARKFAVFLTAHAMAAFDPSALGPPPIVQMRLVLNGTPLLFVSDQEVLLAWIKGGESGVECRTGLLGWSAELALSPGDVLSLAGYSTLDSDLAGNTEFYLSGGVPPVTSLTSQESRCYLTFVGLDFV